LRGIAEWSPAAVFSQGLVSSALEEALAGEYPCVLFAHNYYGTCATGRKCHAFPRLTPCARTFGPACLLLHYPRRCGGLSPLTLASTYRRQARRRALLPGFGAVVVASEHMREELSRHGVAAGRLHRVGLPAPPPAPRVATPGAEAPHRLLLLGRLTDVKGGALLLEAAAGARTTLGRDLSVLVAGSGPEVGRLEKLARRLRLPFELHPWLDDEGRQGLMGSADLLVVPSVWPEPFGLVGIEAGSVGLPAVAFDVGGISDWLRSGHNGEVAPGDPPTAAGLQDALVLALRDPAHYRRLCHGAAESSARHSLGAHLDALEPVLRSVAR
jgi:glycosyltransferase involved in cell wall biosynthesis